jgi:hypothetical protein
MTITDICKEIMAIEEGLDCGTIAFTYDNLSSAMKCGHPVEIFDNIIAEIFWDIQAGKEPEKSKIENVLKGLKRFKRSFKVKELSKPIKDLEAYLNTIN